MFDVLREQDIVKIISESTDDLGLYQIKEIAFDKNDHCGQWWAVKLVLLNQPLEFTWLLDDNHIRQGEFTMSGIPIRLELYARPNVLSPAKSSRPEEIISMF